MKVASGVNPKKVFTTKNAFLGWHFKDIFAKLVRKLKRNVPFEGEFVESQTVPFGPYGGLFFERDLLDIIGLPKVEFFLYCDDYEYTHRINKQLGKIFLIPTSRIEDIDQTWFVKERAGFFKSFLTSPSSYRIYYSIRNRVYFENKNFVRNKIMYNINKFIFLSNVYIYAKLLNQNERLELILKAIQHGEKGILGQNQNIKQ